MDMDETIPRYHARIVGNVHKLNVPVPHILILPFCYAGTTYSSSMVVRAHNKTENTNKGKKQS